MQPTPWTEGWAMHPFNLNSNTGWQAGTLSMAAPLPGQQFDYTSSLGQQLLQGPAPAGQGAGTATGLQAQAALPLFVKEEAMESLLPLHPPALPAGPVCQVPGCGADLSHLKDYYLRYKICQAHCQMPVVVRNGVHQRFCQQCGKFQLLEEFDGDKRTCRRKLERHNARRRKKKAVRGGATKGRQRQGALPAAAAEAAGGGAEEMQAEAGEGGDGDEEMLLWPTLEAVAAGNEANQAGGASSVLSDTAWAAAAVAVSSTDSELDALAAELGIEIPPLEELLPAQASAPLVLSEQAQQGGSLRSFHSAPAQFLALGLGWQPMPASSSVPAGPAPLPAAAITSSPFQQQPQQAQAAQQAQQQQAEGMAAAFPTAAPPAAGPAVAGPAAAGPATAGRDAAVPSSFSAMLAEVLASPSMGVAPERAPALATGAAWQDPAALTPQAASSVPSILTGTGGAQPAAAAAPAPAWGAQAAAVQAAQPAAGQPQAGAAPAAGAPMAGGPMPQGLAQGVQAAARPSPVQQPQLLAQQGAGQPSPIAFLQGAFLAPPPFAAPVSPHDRLHRLSVKLFDATPDALPPELRSGLAAVLGASPAFVEEHLRPGCIHLALSGLLLDGLGTDGRPPWPDIRTAVQSLLESPQVAAQLPRLRKKLLMVQLGDELAVVRGGRVLQVYKLSDCQGVMPTITSVSPICLPASGAGRVLVRGRNILGHTQHLFCRHAGGYPLLEVHAVGQVPAAGSAGQYSSGEGWMEVGLPGEGKSQGLYQLEVQRGCLLGPAKPLLVLKDPQAVAELRQLEINAAGVGDVDAFLDGVGVVLGFLQRFGPGPGPAPSPPRAAPAPAPAAAPAAPAAAERPVEEEEEDCALHQQQSRVEQPHSARGGNCGASTSQGSPPAQPPPQRQHCTQQDALRVSRMACSLTACAVARGWAAVTHLLLPAVTAGFSATEAAAAMDAACPPGRTLLQTALAARNPWVLQVLGAWGQQVGHTWQLSTPGLRGCTVVHLAAAIRDAVLLKALADLNPQGFRDAWATALTDDGYTPAAFADLALRLHSGLASQAAPPAAAAADAAAAAISAPLQQGQQGSGRQEVELAAAQQDSSRSEQPSGSGGSPAANTTSTGSSDGGSSSRSEGNSSSTEAAVEGEVRVPSAGEDGPQQADRPSSPAQPAPTSPLRALHSSSPPKLSAVATNSTAPCTPGPSESPAARAHSVGRERGESSRPAVSTSAAGRQLAPVGSTSSAGSSSRAMSMAAVELSSGGALGSIASSSALGELAGSSSSEGIDLASVAAGRELVRGAFSDDSAAEVLAGGPTPKAADAGSLWAQRGKERGAGRGGRQWEECSEDDYLADSEEEELVEVLQDGLDVEGQMEVADLLRQL